MMIWRITILTLVPALALLALPRARIDSIAYQTEISPDEYAVYDAVIGDLFAGDKVTPDQAGKVSAKLLLIENHTVKYPSDGSTLNARYYLTASISPETLADYERQNNSPEVLKRSLNISLYYLLINSAESKRSVADLRGREVQGTVSVSRVGFNRDRTEALVYRSYICGGLCGYGSVLFLKRADNRWKVETKATLWEA